MEYNITISKTNVYNVEAESEDEARAEALRQWNSETRNCFYDEIEVEECKTR